MCSSLENPVQSHESALCFMLCTPRLMPTVFEGAFVSGLGKRGATLALPFSMSDMPSCLISLSDGRPIRPSRFVTCYLRRASESRFRLPSGNVAQKNGSVFKLLVIAWLSETCFLKEQRSRTVEGDSQGSSTVPGQTPLEGVTPLRRLR